MDKLTREAQEHGEIFESLTLFQKLTPSFSSADIEGFKKFLDEHVEEHFEFEEAEIFPLILSKGSDEEKTLIQELNKQHQEMLGLIKQLDGLVAKYGLQPPEDKKDELMQLNTKIIEALLAHARNEDIKLFPLFKKYQEN